MCSIDEWNKSQSESWSWEELNPEEHESISGLKWQKGRTNPTQRRVIESTSEWEIFKKDIRMVVCVHGRQGGETSKMEGKGKTKSAAAAEPVKDNLTLIMLKVHLVCHDTEARYRAVRIAFNFNACVAGTSRPELVAWAPFRTGQHLEESEAEVSTTTNLSANLGINEHATLQLAWGKQWQKSFEKHYYKDASSNANNDRDTELDYGVEWYLAEDQNLKEGLQADFHLAMLVRPSFDGKGAATEFDGTFRIRTKCGFKQDAASMVGRFFVHQSPPVRFDPTLDPHYLETGKKVEEVVERERNNLGVFEGDGLLRLIGLVNGVTAKVDSSNGNDSARAKDGSEEAKS